MSEEYGQLAAEAGLSAPARTAGSVFPVRAMRIANLPADFTMSMAIIAMRSRLRSWHATLIQYWLDTENVPICIQASEAMRLSSAVNDHASLAIYSYDRTIRYAVFKEMGIRHDIRIFVHDYWEAHDKLPIGVFTLPSGVKITWLA